MELSRSQTRRPSTHEILIVEDNAANAQMLSDFLGSRGYAFRIVGDGPSAIRACLESPPSMVLTDIRLPGMDGLELITRLRELDGFDEVPIIALTSLAMPGDEERCKKAGANAYLAKPVNLRKLRKLLDEFMRES